METYQKELSQIKTILKNNPKGMTVTDIAREIKINRNSVAKYLDVLLISGQADMVTFGPAKVYFPSTRVPLSMILNFTHDYILLLDSKLHIVQANENLLNVLGINREDILGRSIDTFTTLFFQIPEIAQNSHQALNGKTITVEKQYTDNNHTLYLVIQHIPTTYNDGEPGVTLIIEDITKQRQAEATRRRVTQEWDTAFNAITDMIFIRDNDYTVIRANQAFADFLSLTPNECIGKKCYHLLHDSPESPASCPCFQGQHTNKAVTLEFFEPHLNTRLKMSAYPLRNENGDITGSVQVMKAIAEPEKKDR